MNRREAIAGAMTIIGASGVPKIAESSKTVVVGNHRPLIALTFPHRLSQQQREQVSHAVSEASARANCDIVFFADGTVVTAVRNTPYFFSQKMGDYQIEVGCQTQEELRELMSEMGVT